MIELHEMKLRALLDAAEQYLAHIDEPDYAAEDGGQGRRGQLEAHADDARAFLDSLDAARRQRSAAVAELEGKLVQALDSMQNSERATLHQALLAVAEKVQPASLWRR